MCQEGEKTRIFVHTICFGQNFFGPNSVNQEKLYKIVVSQEIAQNQNDTFSLNKMFFDMGEKVGFTNCVLEKAVFFLKTLFL